MSHLQSELDRILYLLMIADSTGEFAKRGDSKPREMNSNGSIVLNSSSETNIINTCKAKILRRPKIKQEARRDTDEPDQFVDYKERKTVLKSQDTSKDEEGLGIENPVPGLIVRKRKQVEKTTTEIEASEGSSFSAEDAIALLLEHEKWYYASEDGKGDNVGDMSSVEHSGKDSKKPKKVLGPERPAFLKSETDYETWVPPKGQSEDERPSLNDRFGY